MWKHKHNVKAKRKLFVLTTLAQSFTKTKMDLFVWVKTILSLFKTTSFTSTNKGMMYSITLSNSVGGKHCSGPWCWFKCPAHCCLQLIPSVMATGSSCPCYDLLIWHTTGTPASIHNTHSHTKTHLYSVQMILWSLCLHTAVSFGSRFAAIFKRITLDSYIKENTRLEDH